MKFEEIMEDGARGFEVVGVAIVIIIGGMVALVGAAKNFRNASKFFADVRRDFGKPLILGLEVLVAADIEVEGMAPWRRVDTEAKLKAAGLDPTRTTES
jgi:uncharacterized membrane protein